MNKNIKLILFATLSIVTYSVFAGPKVISDIYPIQQIANAIAGEETQVIVDSPMSPHQYKIKPSDIQRIEAADLVIRISEHFLANVSRYADDERVLDLINLPDLHKIQSTHHHDHDKHTEHDEHTEHDKDNNLEGHSKTHSNEHEAHHSHSDGHKHNDNHEMGTDPHIWLSPANAKVIAEAIAERLVDLDSKNQQQYADNLRDFEQKIDEQTLRLTEMLKPIQNRPFIVFHDAYQYFEQAFGIEQTAMVRQDVNKGIRAKSFVLLEKSLRDYDHVCVFKEPQFKSSVVDQLALNDNVSVASLDPVGYQQPSKGYFVILDNIAKSMTSCLNK